MLRDGCSAFFVNVRDMFGHASLKCTRCFANIDFVAKTTEDRIHHIVALAGERPADSERAPRTANEGVPGQKGAGFASCLGAWERPYGVASMARAQSRTDQGFTQVAVPLVCNQRELPFKGVANCRTVCQNVPVGAENPGNGGSVWMEGKTHCWSVCVLRDTLCESLSA